MNSLVRFTLFILPGTVLIVLTLIIGWIVLPNFIRGKVAEQVRLVDGSDTWNKWKEPPVPIYLNFYIHHVTNPAEVENGLKPIFKEKGPYSYRERRVKVDLSHPDGPNTVKYREVVTFHFDQKTSGNNSEYDLVNVLNVPFVAILSTIRKMFPLEVVVGLVGNFVLSQENLIRRNVPIRELLFQGFDVTKYTNSLLGPQLRREEQFSGGRFGLYKGKNGTASKWWEIYTGYDSPANFGKVKNWDGRTELGFWRKYSPCDKIKGTDGSLFHPFLTKDSVLDIFGAELCTSISLVFDKQVEFKGLVGYRFKVPDARPEDEEARKCFCLEDDPAKCPLSGVIALESCLKAPMFSSSPYFLGADVRYLAQSGLPNPVKEKHGTILDIEPTTGLILRANKRLQINFEVRHSRKVRALQSLTQESMLFPVMWVDEAQLTDELVADLNSQLFTPLQIIEIGKWVVLGIGILILILGIIAFIVLHGVAKSRSNSKSTGRRLSGLIFRGGSGSAVGNESNLQKKDSQRHSRRQNGVSSPDSRSSASTTSTDDDGNRERANGNHRRY